jgi:nucleotide-binding universal stress UspA family protein
LQFFGGREPLAAALLIYRFRAPDWYFLLRCPTAKVHFLKEKGSLFKEMFNEHGSQRMYANILVSTDGSDVARKGVKHGFALAKALNAKVTVITVTEPLLLDYGSGHAFPTQEMMDSLDEAGKQRAREALDEARAMAEQIGISAELVHVPNAHPATAIIGTAKSRGCDLIVMASHGRRGLRKLILGSQTSEVLVDGSVPVLVVH